MKILVLNAGSSSIKYELFDMAEQVSLVSASIERIGEAGSGVDDHEVAFELIATELASIVNRRELAAVGHRVVHGGDTFVEPTRIDDAVVEQIRELFPLAPLHNPANVDGIDAGRRQFPNAAHVAVFDTAFHAGLPDIARRYAIPASIEQDFGVRRYGFHGTSYRFVTTRAAELLGKPVGDTNIIALHLGNGASACAIENGRSVDTSMGFTPLEGLVMGTRSGNIDPAAVFHLVREAGMSIDDIDTLLNRDSGLKALCGDSDMRSILERLASGDSAAEKAVDLFVHRIRQTIGAYYAILPRTDALVFTAGIGEHRPEIRTRVCAGLEHLGIRIDEAANNGLGASDGFIDTGSAGVRVIVIRTNEALEIARQCQTVLA